MTSNAPIVAQIESPFKPNVSLEDDPNAYRLQEEANISYARAAMRDSLLRGESPFASHLLYTQPGVLDDESPEERKLGIEAGLVFMRQADIVAVYADRGITEGMLAGIRRASELGKTIEIRYLEEHNEAQ